jgi:hypothetical protein
MHTDLREHNTVVLLYLQYFVKGCAIYILYFSLCTKLTLYDAGRFHVEATVKS